MCPGESNSRSFTACLVIRLLARNRSRTRAALTCQIPNRGYALIGRRVSGCTGHGRGSPGSWSGTSNRFRDERKARHFAATAFSLNQENIRILAPVRPCHNSTGWPRVFGLTRRIWARAPWNHPGKIIPPPKCLPTMTLRPRGNAYRNKARQVFKCGNRWVSDVADLQRECVCCVTRRSAARG